VIDAARAEPVQSPALTAVMDPAAVVSARYGGCKGTGAAGEAAAGKERLAANAGAAATSTSIMRAPVMMRMQSRPRSRRWTHGCRFGSDVAMQKPQAPTGYIDITAPVSALVT
jgi:hypothetical protein